ncbi:MAG: hypothetical protein ACLS37_11780 [Alistipes sp.]
MASVDELHVFDNPIEALSVIPAGPSVYRLPKTLLRSLDLTATPRWTSSSPLNPNLKTVWIAEDRYFAASRWTRVEVYYKTPTASMTWAATAGRAWVDPWENK